MTDKELLELAAYAAGIDVWTCIDGEYYTADDVTAERLWNPLTDDGDALRLAVKLDLFWENIELFDLYMGSATHEPENVRRAIVRAAAEIGKTL